MNSTWDFVDDAILGRKRYKSSLYYGGIIVTLCAVAWSITIHKQDMHAAIKSPVSVKPQEAAPVLPHVPPTIVEIPVMKPSLPLPPAPKQIHLLPPHVVHRPAKEMPRRKSTMAARILPHRVRIISKPHQPALETEKKSTVQYQGAQGQGMVLEVKPLAAPEHVQDGHLF